MQAQESKPHVTFTRRLARARVGVSLSNLANRDSFLSLLAGIRVCRGPGITITGRTIITIFRLPSFVVDRFTQRSENISEEQPTNWLHTTETKMFRHVDLPARVPGRLLLHSMPGRYEAIESVWNQVRKETVSAIVCLAENDELHEKSSEYARALEAGTVPCRVLPFEIPDRGAAEDRDAFWTLASDVANRLRSGEAVLIHCAGGVGRTATLAVCVLLALGESASNARSVVSRAGSTVETAPQSDLISWCASQK